MRSNAHKLKALILRKGFLPYVFVFICVITAVGIVYSSVIAASYDDTVELVIEGSDGTVRAVYNVEIAQTPQERAYGLMNREHMAQDHGMIFLEEDRAPRMISMWMKNTLIPLDMLFISEKGMIAHIHENAAPLDLTSISSVFPSIAVIELNAGEVKKHQIQTGDRIKSYKSLWKVKKALEK